MSKSFLQFLTVPDDKVTFSLIKVGDAEASNCRRLGENDTETIITLSQESTANLKAMGSLSESSCIHETWVNRRALRSAEPTKLGVQV